LLGTSDDTEQQQLKAGMVVELEITAKGQRGDGIGHIWGYTIFVTGAGIGTTTKVHVDNVRDRNAWASPVVGGVSRDGEEYVSRVYLPKDTELFGIVTQRLGFKRMYVLCEDGKTRVTRTPGRKRRLWIREGNTIVVQPWPVQAAQKADIVHKYRKAEEDWLRKNGYLDKLQGLE